MEVFYFIICGIVLKLICRSIMVEDLIDKSGPIPKTSVSFQTFLTYDFKFSRRILITEDEQYVADFVKKTMTEENRAVDFANDGPRRRTPGTVGIRRSDYSRYYAAKKRRTRGFEIIARRRSWRRRF